MTKKNFFYYFFSMHLLKYYIPLIIELNKYETKHIICCIPGKKGQNPLEEKNINELKTLQKKYNFNISYNNLDYNKKESILITIEAIIPKDINRSKIKIVSLTYGWDLFGCYNLDKVDYYLFTYTPKYLKELIDKLYIIEKSPNDLQQFYFKNHHKIDKNMYNNKIKYLGTTLNTDSQNYDKETILNKYKIPLGRKYILFFVPDNENFIISPIQILNFFLKKDYYIIIKIRDKHMKNFSSKFKNFCKDNNNISFITDINYYPGLQLEFISISDFVLTGGTSAIIEIVLMNKPIINFRFNKSSNFYSQNFFYDIFKNTKIVSNIDNFDELEKKYNMLNNLLNNEDEIKEELNLFKNKYLIWEKPMSNIIEFLLNINV
jgi:hypothetical protein